MSAAIATEDTLIIETPERVPLHFALASIGNRFLAFTLDMPCRCSDYPEGYLLYPGNYSSLSDHLRAAEFSRVLSSAVSNHHGYSLSLVAVEWATPETRAQAALIREDGRR